MSSTVTRKPRSGQSKAREPLAKRLDLRVREEEKREIDRAAALAGTTTSGFVRQTVLTAARETIHMHSVLRLTLEGSRQFVDAINHPPEPNENLRALVREFGDSTRA